MLHNSRQKFQFFALVFVTILALLVFLGNLNAFQSVPPPKPVPRMKFEGLRKKIYESQWIQLFPNLKKMVQVVTDNNPKAITNAKHTSIKILNPHDLRVGGTLRAIITSYNEAGERKTYGGDFFAVILRRPGSNTDGVTCEVTDDMNGSYSVTCILPWEGAAILEAKLVNPSETVYELMKMFSSERQKGYTLFTTMLNSKNKTEKTECSVGYSNASPSTVCDYSNPTHGEKRTCLRPPSGECSKIIDQLSVRNNEALILPNQELHCKPGYNFMQPVSGSGTKINIKKDKFPMTSYYVGNLSVSLDPSSPTGWRENGMWMSMKSQRILKLDQASLKSCFSNKRIFIFGDSTARNIYRYFIDKMHIKEVGVGTKRYRYRIWDGGSDELNLTITYRGHGPPLGSGGPDYTRPYMSDSFDSIHEGGKGTIVMFTIGYHLHYFDTEVYLRRVRIIKKAAISFISRLPGSKVIVKGLHYLSYDGCRRSPWLTYRFDVILRNEFRDFKNVYFVENWDFTIILNNVHIHPIKPILEGTIQLMLPYIC